MVVLVIFKSVPNLFLFWICSRCNIRSCWLSPNSKTWPTGLHYCDTATGPQHNALLNTALVDAIRRRPTEQRPTHDNDWSDGRRKNTTTAGATEQWRLYQGGDVKRRGDHRRILRRAEWRSSNGCHKTTLTAVAGHQCRPERFISDGRCKTEMMTRATAIARCRRS